jgi:hypothetical protein
VPPCIIPAMGRETTLGGDRRAFEPTLWTVVLRAKEGSRDALGSPISSSGTFSRASDGGEARPVREMDGADPGSGRIVAGLER